ncbi:MAG: response regulator [Candidatus Woesebacteria bacterium]|nr:MAG: response regulator [Candidatus Woesebacteria bacterium]
MKILIIEDERPILKVLSKKLTNAGYEIISSSNGKEGLEVALKEHPDLILLDIILPGMDGMSLLTKLREDHWGSSVPVIILTNLGDGDRIVESKKKGVYDYLIKTDWSLTDVVSKVNEVFKNKL